MSKRLRTLLICLAAVVVLGGAVTAVVLWLPSGDGEDATVTTTTTAAPAISVIDKTKDADGSAVAYPVKSMTVTNAADTFSVITREDKTMAVEAYADLLSDTTAISTMCTDMAGLTALSTVQQTEADSAYGLDAPTATVTVTFHDDTQATVIFGNKTPYETGYYCRVKDTDTLYIVDSTVAEAFQVTGLSLVGKTLIAAPSVNEDDESGSAKLLKLQMTGSCREQAVQVVMDTDGSYPGLTYVSTYVMTAPYLRAVDSDVFTTLSTGMNTLTATGVAAAHPDDATLVSYGLSDPYSTVAFTLAVVSTDTDTNETSVYNTREHMILLGNKDANGNYYALVNGIDVVYTVSPDSVPWAELQYIDLTSKLLFLKDITTVSSVTVTENGTASTFELAHYPDKESKDEQLVATMGGKTYSTSEFRILYQLMISIKRVANAEEGAVASGTPVLQLTMNFNDGSTPMTISLYPMTASRYLCVTDDGEQSAVSISATDNFLAQYHNYLAGEPVTSPY